MELRYTVQNEGYKYRYGGAHATYFPFLAATEGERSIALTAGRGDFAVCQLLLTADCPYVLTVGDVPALSRHHRYETLRIDSDLPFPTEICQEACLPADDGWLYADILHTEEAREYEADAVVPVFFRFSIGADVSPGTYEGRIRLCRSLHFSDEEALGEVTVTLTVLPYRLTQRGDSPLYLDLWQYNCNIARHTDTHAWSDAHLALLDKYLASLGALGQKALTLVLSEAPWIGHNCIYEDYYKANLYEYSIVPITKRKDGKFDYDFSIMQRYIDMGESHGIKEELSVYGLIGNGWGAGEPMFAPPAKDYPDALRIRYFDEASRTYRYMRTSEEIDAYLLAVYGYFVKTEQIDRVRLAADEPHDAAAFRRSLLHVKALCPRFRYKAAIDNASFISEFGDIIDDFVPAITCLGRELSTLRGYQKSMPQSRFAFYVCCKPERPNTFLASPLPESYLMGILPSYLGLDGFLRWNYTCWTDDPFTDVRYRWPAGDMHFVYPAKNGEPLCSLRYFALLRGLQFYDLLEEYRAAYGEEPYRHAVSRLLWNREDIPSDYGEAMDYEAMCGVPYEVFEETRRMLLTALSESQSAPQKRSRQKQ